MRPEDKFPVFCAGGERRVRWRLHSSDVVRTAAGNGWGSEPKAWLGVVVLVLVLVLGLVVVAEPERAGRGSGEWVYGSGARFWGSGVVLGRGSGVLVRFWRSVLVLMVGSGVWFWFWSWF